ncbi:hypothetical protein EMIT07CA2_60262 [Brevibacillus sp. IT-7CA2]
MFLLRANVPKETMRTTKPSVFNISKKGASDISEVIAITMTIIAVILNQRGFLFTRHTDFLFW